MSPDPDETVFVDDDGLAFSQDDYPAADYPVGTRVRMAGVPEVEGTVVGPHQAAGDIGADGPTLHVPILWDGSDFGATWQHVDGLEKI